MSTSLAERVEDIQKGEADKARLMLSRFAGRAAEILEELAETSENDRIRLSAVNSILDRIGVAAPQEHKVTVTPEEHQIIRTEAEETLARIQANMQAAQVRRPISLEAVVLHEGEPEPA